LKYSLTAKEAQKVLSCANQFKTKNISFKYLPSSRPAVAFSLSRTVGPAVLRNRFKRQSRALLFGELFNDHSLHLLVHSRIKLTKNLNVFDDFSLFKEYLEKNKS
jgi:ribonuclease P protein component